MRKLMLLNLSLVLALLTGCEKEPLSTSSTSNPNVQVDLLVEHDGCKIYRFRDEDELHYWAKCTDQDSVFGSLPKGRNQSTDTSYSTPGCEKH